ncbi:hypothetical protein [uncultured Chloroflexus sp.]|uniref:hypothetical protein n=1 Tax=uncultured Chloroflexus sp. TaxID=214040 RepID=UPI002608FEA8|nr:hypothetical protein [uncultured Chloroflexus sp.]
MIAYNFHAASNGARGEAKGGRWGLALPASGQAPALAGWGQEDMPSAERETIRRLHIDADPTEARLLTAVYVSLKTYPCVVLSGRAGAGKAALVQHLVAALIGVAPGQFVRIGSAQWTAQSGQRDYYRDLHTRFGDSQLSEVLSEAQSPQGAGKLYFVLFDGLAPDELFHYLHERLHLLPVAAKPVAALPNVLFIATFHQPNQLSVRDAQLLAYAHQVNVTAYRRQPPQLPPPVGLQRAMIRDSVRDVVEARDRLRAVFGGPQLPQLSPSAQIAGFLRWYGLAPDTTLDSDMWLFLANSFDRYGNGLFAADPARNLQIAYDFRMVQRVMARLDPANAALRPELARAVGC